MLTITTPWNDLEIERLVDDAIASNKTKIKRSHMKLGEYNGFSGTQRVLADWKIKIAIEQGLIPKAVKCSVCGSEEGRIDYHNEDYNRPLLTTPICVKCHLALHNRLRYPTSMTRWMEIAKKYGDGTKWFEAV